MSKKKTSPSTFFVAADSTTNHFLLGFPLNKTLLILSGEFKASILAIQNDCLYLLV